MNYKFKKLSFVLLALAIVTILVVLKNDDKYKLAKEHFDNSPAMIKNVDKESMINAIKDEMLKKQNASQHNQTTPPNRQIGSKDAPVVNDEVDFQKFAFDQSSLYKEVVTKLDDSPAALAIAHWAGIGTVPAGDQAHYLFKSAVNEMNRNSEATLEKISQLAMKLDNKENFLRSLSYSAVSHLKISAEKKQEFYFSEVSSSFSNVENINDNAERLGLALTYLGQTQPSAELLKKSYREQISGISNKQELERINLYWTQNFKDIKF